jgi:hypothetical protein
MESLLPRKLHKRPEITAQERLEVRVGHQLHVLLTRETLAVRETTDLHPAIDGGAVGQLVHQGCVVHRLPGKENGAIETG